MAEMVELRHDGHTFVDDEGNRYLYDQAAELYIPVDENGRCIDQAKGE